MEPAAGHPPGQQTWGALGDDLIHTIIKSPVVREDQDLVAFKLSFMNRRLRANQAVQAGAINHLADRLPADAFAAHFNGMLNRAASLRDTGPFSSAMHALLLASHGMPHEAVTHRLLHAVHCHKQANDTEQRREITLRTLTEFLPDTNSVKLRRQIDCDARKLQHERFANLSIARAQHLHLSDSASFHDAITLLARADEFESEPRIAAMILCGIAQKLRIYFEEHPEEEQTEAFALLQRTSLSVNDLPLIEQVQATNNLLHAAYQTGDDLYFRNALNRMLDVVDQHTGAGGTILNHVVDDLVRHFEKASDNQVLGESGDSQWNRLLHVCETQYKSSPDPHMQTRRLRALGSLIAASPKTLTQAKFNRLLLIADLEKLTPVHTEADAEAISIGIHHLFSACILLPFHADAAAWHHIAEAAYSPALHEHTRFSSALAGLNAECFTSEQRRAGLDRTYHAICDMPDERKFQTIYEVMNKINVVHSDDMVDVFGKLSSIALTLPISDTKRAYDVIRMLFNGAWKMPTVERPAQTANVAMLLTRFPQSIRNHVYNSLRETTDSMRLYGVEPFTAEARSYHTELVARLDAWEMLADTLGSRIVPHYTG